MHFAMKNGKFGFSLRKFLAISLVLQKIASDCGCDAVVHLASESIRITVRVPCFLSRMQFQEIIPLRFSQQFSAITVT